MFKDKIKSLRLARNLNQEDVATAIGTTKTTYIKYEKGTSSPLLSTIEKIAKFYGVSAQEIVSDEEPDIDERLKTKLSLIKQLGEKEKESIIMMIESVAFRYQTAILNKKFDS